MKHCVQLEPKGLQFDCADGETLADAAERAAIRFPISCRNGVCHICKARLESGMVQVRGEPICAESQQNEILVCHAVPRSDLIVRMDGVLGPNELPMKQITCQIKQVEAIRGNVYRVVLEQPAGKAVEFLAGQYLALLLPGKEDAFFSIASAPGQRQIELHIQADPHLQTASEIVAFLSSNPSVQVKLPFGKACLSAPPDARVLLLAAGTGFAQMKSVIDYLLDQNFDQELSLYWTARKQSDLYMMEEMKQLAELHVNFNVEFLVTDTSDPSCVEHHELLADAVTRSHETLKDSLVFVAGSPKMVYSSLDALEQSGLSEDAFFSDVLEYVSRDQI